MARTREVLAKLRLVPFLFGVLFVTLGVSELVGASPSSAWVSATLLATAGLAGLLKAGG